MKREDIEKVAKDYSIGKTYFRRNVLKEVDADDYVLRKGNCSEDFIAGAEWGIILITAGLLRKIYGNLSYTLMKTIFHVKCSKVFLINVAQRKCKAVAKGLHRKYYLH